MLMTSCSKETGSKQVTQEVCNGQEECVQIGDELVGKINKKLEGISELEESIPIEDEELFAEYEEESQDEERYFFLTSYYIHEEEIIAPYEGEIDTKLLKKAFKDDKELREYILLTQEDTEYHEMLWDLYSTLIPAKYREDITEFDLITDGYDYMLAHVMQNPEIPEQWTLSLDALDSEVYFDEMMKTLIHETVHVLTLNDSQVPVDEKYLEDLMNEEDVSKYKEQCKTLHLIEGCAKKDSYINQFYEQFWTDIEQEWLEKDVEMDLGAQVDFFEQHQDKFVSEYATTNVAEDIAETITAFILSDSKTVQESQEMRYKKIAFFYQFPEFIQMRADILSGLYELSKDVEVTEEEV